jgi:hypothetical protein
VTGTANPSLFFCINILCRNQSVTKERELMSTTYPHLTNGDVANLLADHRLLQVHPRAQRYANDPCPAGDGLIALAKERLIAVAVVREPFDQPEPQAIEVRKVFTQEQGLVALASIGTLPELVEGYAVAAIGTDESGVTDYLAEALVAMQQRITAAVAATIEPVRIEVQGPKELVEVPAAGPTDAELVERYNSINSLEALEAELSAQHGEEVLLALVGMTDRIRASIIASQEPAEKVAEAQAEPAPAADQQ